MQIVEGISGTWLYHLGEDEWTGRAICGREVMRTSAPLETWNRWHPTHIPVRYCAKCEALRKEREADPVREPAAG